MENEKNIDAILKDLPNVPENGKSNIKWLLLALNPVPLEFYRHLNRKTKHIATDAYTSALSTVLTKLKDVICKERIQLLVNIQIRWQNGEFKRDWTAYIAEKSVMESVKASYYVQRNYNSEISHIQSGPSTPNKPIIQQELKRKFPHVSFTKRVKVIYDKLQNESLRNLEQEDQNRTEESENEDQLRKQYENEEPGVLINNEDRNNYDDQVVAVDWREWLENI
ncbi:hypothetical protein F8M41_012558 [Gigaspora margarita]|uniref:Uncharacterized protein n=1 Tax=Gigaspora margarita TaxID=4874 RepID=A0A8H3X0T1_GIGMA|nr:hypothetical protein F8M41_012558 [Gigaspora margarita]